MTKQDIVRDIESKFGNRGLLSITQVAEYLGCHPNKATKFIKGMDFIGGKTHKYLHVRDIAEKIMSEKKVAI